MGRSSAGRGASLVRHGCGYFQPPEAKASTSSCSHARSNAGRGDGPTGGYSASVNPLNKGGRLLASWRSPCRRAGRPSRCALRRRRSARGEVVGRCGGAGRPRRGLTRPAAASLDGSRPPRCTGYYLSPTRSLSACSRREVAPRTGEDGRRDGRTDGRPPRHSSASARAPSTPLRPIVEHGIRRLPRWPRRRSPRRSAPGPRTWPLASVAHRPSAATWSPSGRQPSRRAVPRRVSSSERASSARPNSPPLV